MRSNKIAPEGLERAFIDVVRFSIRIASGDEISNPGKDTAREQFDISFALASMEWDRYKQLAEIVEPTGRGELVDEDTAARCLEAYVKRECPGSPADMEVKAIYDSMGRVGSMDDPEVSKTASELTTAIRKHAFSPTWLY